jgi:microsomal dipeptidase-like Zn-dependent dipeptidase
LRTVFGWEHIALTGDYVWTTGNAAPDFRSLRDVPSAFMPRAA